LLRRRDAEEIECGGGQCGRGAAPIRSASDRTQGAAGYVVRATFVTQQIAPSAGSGRTTAACAAERERTGAGDQCNPRTIRPRRGQRRPPVVDEMEPDAC